ncbi:response regulator [Nitrospira sp. M1]
MTRPRILLADDHTLIAEGVSKLIESEFDLIGIIQDGQTLIREIRTLAPDVLLLDISLPSLNGFDAAQRIKTILPSLRIIFLTMHTDPSFVNDATAVGASGYVVKQSAASELILAIREVLDGRTYYSPSIADDSSKQSLSSTISERRHSSDLEQLTPRQREILQLVAEGRSNKEIAATLSLSLKTVEFHKHRMMRRLNLHTTAELTKLAITHRIVPT